MTDDYKSKTLDQIETDAFRDGVRYALQDLRDVFGDEIIKTDLWKEYASDK